MSLEQEIKDKALDLGFDAVGITDASRVEREHVEHLRAWLDDGLAGEMHYMHRHFEKRIAPARLLRGSASVVVVALNYKPARGPAPAGHAPTGRVARYAWYEDYHTVMKPLLFELADFIRSRTDESQRFKACVDSVPLLERALAVRAGLGFIGRNHLLIGPTLGPEVFLGELLTTVRLGADAPYVGSCSGCRRCIEACPTGALRADGRFDARRCISYLTIEHRGEIPAALAAKMGDRIFGCDECVLACPHHQAAPACAHAALTLRPERSGLDLAEVLKLTDESFARKFGRSPISRTGLAGLQRNARHCAANIRRP